MTDRGQADFVNVVFTARDDWGMTDREQFNAEYRAAWDGWARRSDDGNPMQGILLGCIGGLLLWIVGVWIGGCIR